MTYEEMMYQKLVKGLSEGMSDDIDLTDDEYDTFIVDLAEQRCQHSHADTACPPPPERAILLDLIAELQSEWEVVEASDGHRVIRKKSEGWVKAAADRAEARLREASGGDE